MASVGAAESIGECKAECHVRGDVVGLSDVGHDSTLRSLGRGDQLRSHPRVRLSAFISTEQSWRELAGGAAMEGRGEEG